MTIVCSRIANMPPNSILGKTWEFSAGRILRLGLKKKDWLQLREFLDILDGMTPEDAAQIRMAVSPFTRIEHPRIAFNIPNP
jgi:hypothetical protein